MTLDHRPVEPADLPLLCTFPHSAEELFFLFPTATDPLAVAPLATAIARRTEATVVTRESTVVGFANFARWPPQAPCTLGNVIVTPATRSQGVGR